MRAGMNGRPEPCAIRYPRPDTLHWPAWKVGEILYHAASPELIEGVAKLFGCAWNGRRRMPLLAGQDQSDSLALLGADGAEDVMRDNWLSNRVFDNAEALLDDCCAAWNRLEARPRTIMSLGLRDWAHGF